ncbi:metal ABC transporter permease [Thermoactinomyces sp. DSM 45892]|uniref:metal ABC transporter permease n=1 Tax=Thermoactinomyces sp. DSM 45892 TaxID=1882753 RepID=UPI0008971C37|nr:metal ABC transporter permease [Thermoactinomyces sp. DSM 45892]SDZ35983.1 zinc transport system permease protein [Thermoactinomyces sp. DSM 45892]
MIEDFLQYEFLQHALYAGLLIGLISPLIGVYLVVRRLSLIADALSHVTLSGVAAGLFLQKKLNLFTEINPIYIGMGFSVIGSLFVERLRRMYRTYSEIAIPIIMSGGIGLGVVLISAADGFNVDITGYLFGNILAVRTDELQMILMVAAITLLVLFLFRKELFALSFDEENAVLTGVNRSLVHFLFIVVVALVIASSIRVVGILLVSALVTLPVATALQHTNSFRQTLIASVLYGELSVILGLLAAYRFDLASGGAIVLVSIMMLLCVFLIKKVVYLISRIRKNR